MRATGIRALYKGFNKKANQYEETYLKVSASRLHEVCQEILKRTSRAGFRTEVRVLNSTSIKIGLHMSSFRVITSKLGYNARTNRFIKSPKGYKRTNVPTWDQRVEFNNIVNAVFNKFQLRATIKSGAYTVRTKQDGAMGEDTWYYQTPSYVLQNINNGYGEIMPEVEARKTLSSDRLEKEHHEKTKARRLEQSREYRKRIKLFEKYAKVLVDGFWSYPGKPNKNGKLVTHSKFGLMLSNLSPWEARRVRQASIKATVNQVNTAHSMRLIQGGAA